MSMDKFGVAQPDLISGLRNEEARLMGEVAKFMSSSVKTASDQAKLNDLESRLSQVRMTITEHDLVGKK